MEFAQLRTGVTVNAIRAGVTGDARPVQIPEPNHCPSSTPIGQSAWMDDDHDDIAQAIVALRTEGAHLITRNVLGVDGGELFSG